MSENGSEVKVEPTDELEIEYSEHYLKLVEFGLDEAVAAELDNLIQLGQLGADELDSRAMDGLKQFPPESRMLVLEEMKGSQLENVSNKSAYMCGIMKALREKQAAGVPAVSGMKKPGPDEAKIKEILNRTGYSLEITSGQRKYGGPPPDWEGPQPGAGHEVFCGKIPNYVFEDVLIPLFEQCGTIWDLRLMMDPSTSLSKTFCFVTFTDKSGAQNAVKTLDNYEIRPGKRIKVNISVAKVRLFVGNIPKQKTKDQIKQEFAKLTEGLRDVLVYANPDDATKKNRGFCFIDYDSHKAAANAKRKFETGGVCLWGRQFIVNWAEAQDEPDEATMSKVKVLYVKNLRSTVEDDELKAVFEPYGKVERVKKAKDYAFIHFETREAAVSAMEALDGKTVCECEVQISLAKPPSMNKSQHQQGGGGYGGGYGGQQPHLNFPPRGGRGRGRGYPMPMAMQGYGGYGGGDYGYGYDGGYGGEDYGYGYDDGSYGYGAEDYGYVPPAPVFNPRGRARPPMTMRGGRGGFRGRGAAGGGYGAAGFQARPGRGGTMPGMRGRGGATRMTTPGRGAPRGAAVGGAIPTVGGVKRKVPGSFGQVEAKKAATGDAWGTQPIPQQPLSDDQWYTDSWT